MTTDPTPGEVGEFGDRCARCRVSVGQIMAEHEAEVADLRARMWRVEALADGPFDPTRRELRAALTTSPATEEWRP